MAKYKNREVTIVEDLPHPNGSQVRIQHLEPGTVGFEVVPKSQVWITEDEKKSIDKARQDRIDNFEYRLIGKDQPVTVTAPTVEEVRIQRMAEDNLKRSEDQKRENEEWLKKHPRSDNEQKRALDAIKVVPYRDETPAKVDDRAAFADSIVTDKANQTQPAYSDTPSKKAK